ncbi:MAG: DegT/DnrJ/EryC1/StrS family aminotransferase [Methanolobus sp.]|uniref:DegT/DnrJ/EryC1/StrS family aminotransferase n=1 Tax=Methanolobus sp. TaxID=1874737 RepID=UPI00272F509B|nr:DegT/DnrJ/EryC1/StrS family aminotransferase [Methanolobus sp.]MDP2217203.1 DegT/DnrJ/EryC1/StrS family aminotransferase [Methanolobus sp.]
MDSAILKIPFLMPPLGDEEIEAASRVMRTKYLTGGGEADLFEKEFAEYIGTESAISTNSGTSALELVLHAYKCMGALRPGDKVLIPSFTFVAVANAVVNAGMEPVFADITPQTMNIKLPNNIEDIKAAIIVHTFGTPCDTSIIRYLQSKGVIVIEDCAEAMGARWWGSQKKVGSRGDCGIFSFAATKIMTTGDGGMITTNATSLTEYIKLLRVHGLSSKINSDERSAILPGHNYRMCNILAAIGRVQLSKADEFCKARRKHAQKLNELITMEQIPVLTPWDFHYSVYQIYTIQLKEGDSTTRAAVLKALRERGIEAKVYFYPPIHQQAYYSSKYGDIGLKCTDRISERVISLPMYPSLEEEEIEYMVQCLKEVLC